MRNQKLRYVVSEIFYKKMIFKKFSIFMTEKMFYFFFLEQRKNDARSTSGLREAQGCGYRNR